MDQDAATTRYLPWVVATVLVALIMAGFSLSTRATPVVVIVAMGLANSLRFSSINSMAYPDIADAEVSMASTLASTLQQMSLSFGLACGSLVTAYYPADLPQSNRVAVLGALHSAFVTLAVMTAISRLSFWTLRAGDGANISRGGE